MRGGSGALTESAKLTASDRRLFDAFGHSVTVSGDTVVAGMSDKMQQRRPRLAHVFVKPPGGWAGTLTESVKLIASDGAEFDELGSSVAVSGDTVVGGCAPRRHRREGRPRQSVSHPPVAATNPPTGSSPSPGCTVNGVPNQMCLGTPGRDTITGTPDPDVILGLGGNDTNPRRGR